MEQKILITVAGQSNSGKSRITWLIKKCLKENGFDVDFTPSLDFQNETEFDIHFNENSDFLKQRKTYKIKLKDIQLSSNEFNSLK